MSAKSTLIQSIQNIAGIEGVSLLAISPESPDFMVVEIYFDPDTVCNRLTPEEVTEQFQIDINELLDYKNTQTHLYAKQGKKELRLTFNGSFEVRNDRIKVFEGLQPLSAIEFYNSLNM
jgi:hypothetical protein